MNRDQRKLLVFYPVIVFTKCIAVVGTVLRETPKELKAAYRFLGRRKYEKYPGK